MHNLFGALLGLTRSQILDLDSAFSTPGTPPTYTFKQALPPVVLLPQAAMDPFNAEKQRALSQHLASEIRRNSTPFQNPVVDAYVQRLGSLLVSQLPETRQAYTFEVVSTGNGIQPMPIPGGLIFIPAEMFRAVKDEAEFAAWVAHAIGHIELRQGFRAVVSASGMATVPLIFMGGWGGIHSEPGKSLSVPAGFQKFRQSNEAEAEAFGSALLSRAWPSAVQDDLFARCRQIIGETSPLKKERKPPSLYRK